jgi:hypothetical protein
LLGALAGTSSFTGLTIGRTVEGFPDNDWYRGTVNNSGTATISVNYQSAGDLHVRVFTLGPANTLVELGSSRALRAQSQQVTVSVIAGQPLLVWVFGFDNVQGNYDLTLTLS